MIRVQTSTTLASPVIAERSTIQLAPQIAPSPTVEVSIAKPCGPRPKTRSEKVRTRTAELCYVSGRRSSPQKRSRANKCSQCRARCGLNARAATQAQHVPVRHRSSGVWVKLCKPAIVDLGDRIGDVLALRPGFSEARRHRISRHRL